MVMKDCLEKNVQKKVLIEKHREYYLVLDEETGAIFLVNETSHFLYENCDGQSVESLCELLFDRMEGLRTPVDELEMIVDKEVWPMPSYGDLLFEV